MLSDRKFIHTGLLKLILAKANGMFELKSIDISSLAFEFYRSNFHIRASWPLLFCHPKRCTSKQGYRVEKTFLLIYWAKKIYNGPILSDVKKSCRH